MTPSPGILRRSASFWLGEEGLSAFLLLLFVALFLGPLTHSRLIALLTSLAFSLVMVAGVASVSDKRSVRFAAGAVAVAAIVLRWLTHLSPTPEMLRSSSASSLVFMILLTLGILHKVFLDGNPVTVHHVRGGVAAYLLLGITWSILYGLLDQTLPHAFNLPEAGTGYSPDRQEHITYFSFVTLATLGYGDITPTHDVSRLFTVVEALVGQLYPATLLARLVSLEVSHRSSTHAS